jgi:AcrR family transcriptional regulator
VNTEEQRRATRNLSPEKIERAALEVIDREGLEDFSLRKLAEPLGCHVTSIRHHFPSKAHLMDALIDRMIGEMKFTPSGMPWEERFDSLVGEWRKLARRYPKMFFYFSEHRKNTPAGLRLLEHMLSIYADAGLGPEAASRLFRVSGYMVIGGLLDEVAGYTNAPSARNPPGAEEIARDFPHVAAAAPYFRLEETERTLALGIEMIKDGVRKSLAEARAAENAKRAGA